MKTLCAVLLSLLLISSAFASGDSPIAKASKASFEIMQATVNDSSGCSATAIGPHALFTASHCELPDDVLYIRGISDDVTIVARIRDGLDHSILLLQGVTFADYVDVDLSPPAVAQNVFTFGNPGDWQDIFQKGYIAGIQVDHSEAAAMGHGKPPVILIALQAFSGESGAGIFNAEGKVIAVLGFNAPQQAKDMQISFAGAFPLVFKQEDLDKARAFVPPAQVKK